MNDEPIALIECNRCGQHLNRYERWYLHGGQTQLNRRYAKEQLESVCQGYVCSVHWCSCMPKGLPIEFLKACEECNEPICKSCSYSDDKSDSHRCISCFTRTSVQK